MYMLSYKMSQDYCNIQMFIYLFIPRIKYYMIVLAVVSDHFYMCYTCSYTAGLSIIMLVLKATHNQDCYLATKITMINDLTEAMWL